MRTDISVVLILLAVPLGCGGGGGGGESPTAPEPSPVALTISAYSPGVGPATGGTGVTLFGTGFRAGMTVTFGGSPAISVNVFSSTRLTAVAPAHAEGVVDVVAADADGRSVTLTKSFRYLPVDPDNPDACYGCWDY